jgi:hypothetical protein
MGLERPDSSGTDRSAWSYILMSAEVALDPAHLEAGKPKMKKRKPPYPKLVGQQQSRTGATADDAVMRWIERRPFRSSSTGPTSQESRMTMTTPDSATKVKTRGRLNRAVLAMLGKGLEDCFDEVRKQEVPERFKLLLQQF